MAQILGYPKDVICLYSLLGYPVLILFFVIAHVHPVFNSRPLIGRSDSGRLVDLDRLDKPEPSRATGRDCSGHRMIKSIYFCFGKKQHSTLFRRNCALREKCTKLGTMIYYSIDHLFRFGTT